MSDGEITVKVTQYADRKYFLMYYVDPVTERPVTRSTRKTIRRDAEREAAKWEAELREGRYVPKCRITWEEFRDKYESQKLPSLAKRTRDAAASAMNHVERVLDPAKLASLTPETLSRFQAELRAEGMTDTTLDTHLGHLRAALSWAVTMGYLRRVPEIERPKRVKGRKFMRGRPITEEEFERMLAAVPKVRKSDPGLWQRYLKGLWLSGLRLEESLTFSWDVGEPFAVDLGGRYPKFRICARAEKGNRDRLLPMTPDFAAFLLETPEDEREGRVFRIEGLWTGDAIQAKRVSRIVSSIGEKAGIVVNRETKLVKEKVLDENGEPTGRTKLVEREVLKYASAHDLRRSFGTRWARRVKQATLQKLMRHASIETTLKYYVELDADDMAAEIYQQFHQQSAQNGPKGHLIRDEGGEAGNE